MKHSCGFPLETTWQQRTFINCCRIVAILGLGLGSPGAAATPRLSRTINPGGERATSPGVSYCSLFLTEQSIPTTPPLRSAVYCMMHNALYNVLHCTMHCSGAHCLGTMPQVSLLEIAIAAPQGGAGLISMYMSPPAPPLVL